MKVTVFTPAYNRADTLPRLFAALRRQTDKRFEWLIIDDGSTDNTEHLIQDLCHSERDFEIRYYKQEHGGKPRAQNKAIDLAKGDLFITCDSNKYPSDHAIEFIIQMAEMISDEFMMGGVGGYRANFAGVPYGGEIKLDGKPFVDCTFLEGYQYNIVGDHASAFFTNVLRKYKSPVYPGEHFISEAVWLIPMAMDGYKIRWFPEILIFGEYTADGLTKQGANSRKGHMQNFQGFLHQLRLEIAAHGAKSMRFLIYEAMDIAKEKGMPNKVLCNNLGCSMQYILYLQFIRFMHSVYGVISNVVKLLIGKSATEYIRNKLGR